jgi:hypothetical protein
MLPGALKSDRADVEPNITPDECREDLCVVLLDLLLAADPGFKEEFI